MLVAVLSDIHSNVFALRAVLQDTARAGAREIWISGDTFGYYPWAADTFGVLEAVSPRAVLGNHDLWVIDAEAAPHGIAGELARQNAEELAVGAPRALRWLASLAPECQFERDGWCIRMAHGTPEDPLEGRYYPDDVHPYTWLPRENQIVILGQTHYPLLRGAGRIGLTLNPGSVGQSRDGNPMPSWALLDLSSGQAWLRRTPYDNRAVMETLRALAWDEKTTLALERK